MFRAGSAGPAAGQRFQSALSGFRAGAKDQTTALF
jgi:hypothetical protein